MRVSRIVLGGGRQYLAPRAVWSPAGGWWASSRPQEAPLTDFEQRRNVLIGIGVYLAAGAWIWTSTAPLEVRFWCVCGGVQCGVVCGGTWAFDRDGLATRVGPRAARTPSAP